MRVPRESAWPRLGDLSPDRGRLTQDLSRPKCGPEQVHSGPHFICGYAASVPASCPRLKYMEIGPSALKWISRSIPKLKGPL